VRSQQAKIQASDKQAGDKFGYSVSISGDGNTAIAGAYNEDTGATDAGSAYIFTRSGTTWTQQAKIQASDKQAYDQFGWSVSISSNGNTAIVGAYTEDTGGSSAGAAYIFTRSGTTWTQQAKIQASDKATSDLFGYSVSISGDGNTAIAGALFEEYGGSAYIFTRSGTTWTQQAKIQASDRQASDFFGSSVSMSSNGNTAIVGAMFEDTGGSSAGAAYIFTRSGTTWTQQVKIQASDKQASDNFGVSVAISDDGNTAIVGAYTEDTGGTNAGAAYIFTRSGTTWTQQAKIQASDKQASDFFGHSVAISSNGNTALVGAYNDHTGSDRTGSAYIFTRSGTTWTQQARIQASDKQASDNFGWSVAISDDGNTTIAGAYNEDTGGTDTGAAYIFEKSYYI
jgi:regulation of enolase protein 1 (concanavalin A-like superfamily)